MTIKEARRKIIEVINQSGLAIDVIELLLENLFAVVHQQAEEAYASMEDAPVMPEPAKEAAPKKETGKKSK